MDSNKNMELLKSYEDYRLKCKSLGIEPLDVSISLKNSIVTLTKSDNKNIK